MSAYRESLASAMALPADRFDVDGVSVVAGDDRRGQRLVSHYRVGRHSVLWVDPELAGEVADFDGRAPALAFDEFGAWAGERDAELLGRGREHLLPRSFDTPSNRPEVQVLDGTDPRVVELVAALLAECSDDDREEADFDLDALDRFLVGWIGPDAGLRALAGGRVFEARPGFVDVGVLVRPSARRAGRGRSVIAGVVAAVLAAGETPLYRCGAHNVASQRLCRGLGFELVLELEAFRWPDPG